MADHVKAAPAAHPRLSAMELVHLVRLASDRAERVILRGDGGISTKVMNSLARKGMAVTQAQGWGLSPQGMAVASDLL